ncbi:hypothetical protein FQN49_007411 [Arthroderma sp. PD_2]|nr:hypothetical protein FQN49_007411 [Arthroderma sp. PD_2]
MIRGEYFRDTDAWKKEFGGLTPSQWADLWTSRLVGRRITALDPKKYETEYSSFEQIFPCGPPRYPLDMTISPSATAAQTNGRSKPSLMTLPTELLLQIIEEALSPSESYSEYCARGSSVSWFMFSGISLIFSCKRLYVLGRPIAIRHYTFDASQLPSTTFLFEPGSTPYDIFQEVDLR